MSFDTTVMFGACDVTMKSARIAALIRIRIRRVGDVDRELLEVVELAERAEHADVAVEQAVAAAHDGAAVAEHDPRRRRSRGPKLLVSPRWLTSTYGSGTGKAVRVEIFVRRTIEPLVAQAEVDGDVGPQAPVVLHEADVVLGRMAGRVRRCDGAEGRRAGQGRDRRRVVRIEELIARERVGPEVGELPAPSETYGM